MKSFNPNFLSQIPISNDLLKIVRELGEYRGKEFLFRQQSPQTLETLLQNAMIQSTESSNRIEGVTVESPERLKALMRKKARPKNRSEQEIAGYRDVLSTIHLSHQHIRFNSNIVLQFHKDLFKFATTSGGHWKSSNNDIVEIKPDGRRFIRFKPIPAWQTEESMGALHKSFEEALLPPMAIEPLLAIAAYVLDFLCVHPFNDGNGRVARLLTLLLLYRFGYGVGKFISLERIIEETKEGYYDSLYKSSQGWHQGKHDIRPWLEYFLGVVLRTAYREFDERVGQMEMAHGAKGALVIAAIEKLPMKFTISELADKCPTVGLDYIRKLLREQRLAGNLKSTGRGPDAAWIKRKM
ncbi:MAG: Fic family protein [Proteobacteria bacterium]|nr:Fic family protein [bacterium]NDC23938.1 Fic family protein [Pseudomonadota bacterium]NDD03834.1 Fic family protein [Pseudomonadota bacterium]